jgi:hypothetical protein
LRWLLRLRLLLWLWLWLLWLLHGEEFLQQRNQ